MVPVLVIDHDKERLAGTSGVLSSHGYCPLGAHFDSDALSLLSDLPVGVALVECQAAAPNHTVLIDSIRRRHPRGAVIAVVDGGLSDRCLAGRSLDAPGVAAWCNGPSNPQP